MTLVEMKEEFMNDARSKWEYAHDVMNASHKRLWEYVDYLKGTDISEIRINKEEVYFEIEGGVFLTCDPRDERAMPMDILNFGSYEKSNMKNIEKVLNLFCPEGIYFDIGANIGYTSIIWAKKFKKAKIYAFELMEPTFERLKKNIQINDVEKNIISYNYGISDKNESIDCYYYPWVTANSSMENLQESDDVQIIKCRCIKLDDFSEVNKLPVDFVKFDVEGAEFLAIKGMTQIIKNNTPVIVTELLRTFSAKYGYHPNVILDILNENGYTCIGLDDDLQKIEDMKETEYRNFMFLHRKKHRKAIELFGL